MVDLVFLSVGRYTNHMDPILPYSTRSEFRSLICWWQYVCLSLKKTCISCNRMNNITYRSTKVNLIRQFQ